MYRLILDRAVMNDYVKVIAPSVNSNPDTFNATLYTLLRQHSRPLELSIYGDSIIPVRMLVTIRTDLSNEVLVPTNGLFYSDCTLPYPSKHPVDDVVMLSAKTLVDRLFDCGDNTPLVIRRTIVYPIGACIYRDEVYVYVNVVIDHTLKNDQIFKTKGCHFEEILYLTPNNSLEGEMLKRLTIVKGDNNHV